MCCIGNVYGPYYTSYLTSFLSRVWSFFVTKVVLVFGFVCATFHHSIMGTGIQTLERKHGCWRLTSVLPMFLMVLSCINVATVQATIIQVHTARQTKLKSHYVFSNPKNRLVSDPTLKSCWILLIPINPFKLVTIMLKIGKNTWHMKHSVVGVRASSPKN